MDDKQQRILRLLITAKALCFPLTQSGSNGSRRQSVGPSPRIIDIDALLTDADVRTYLIRLSAQTILRISPDVRAISSSSVPFGNAWFAAMVAHEMGKPFLQPREIGRVGTVQGSVPFETKAWLVDADPDADSHLLQAAEMVFSSEGSGCDIGGVLTIVERDGHTRNAIARRFPHAAFHTLVDLQACLQDIVNGEKNDRVSAAEAGIALNLLKRSSGATMRPPPGFSIP